MMLQTDEVDEDYFTPVQSTSLANIFGDNSKRQENKENESLKYTPPRQQNVIQKLDDSKLTQCIFACAVTGHEWLNQAYVNKGKLGLAIIKINKTNTHNIILYDSNKTTLSCSLISTKLEVTVNNNHILYYDNLGKSWCIYAAEEEITNILDLLKNLNVTLRQTSHREECLTKSSEECTETNIFDKNTKDVGSDTDSSVNRKTKSSILNRMAMMGHSVLPPQTNVMEKTSDSSDNNDSHFQTKLVRHKPIKNMMKRSLHEKSILLSEPQKVIETQQRVIVHQKDQLSEQNPLYTNVDRVLMSVPNPGLFNKSGNEFDFFVSEQRISNSELRINLSRLTDKIDHIGEKINNLEHKSYSPNNFQMEILQKLMLEYEHKIKVYEDYFKSKGLNEVLLIAQKNPEVLSHPENEFKIMENKIKELEQSINNKDIEINILQNEIQMLVEKVNQHSIIDKSNADLMKRIEEMEQILSEKNEDLLQISKNYESVQSKTEGNDGEKLKTIMNETYSIIAKNFDNDEVYRGEVIKKTIAGVIRKVTIDLLNNS